MPSNPTVIPGTFGADTSGLVRLGQALGQIFNQDDQALERGMAILRDPTHMEGAAKRLEGKYAEQEAKDIERKRVREVAELRRQGLGLDEISPEDQEAINKLADPIGSSIVEGYRTEMFAVGLDPDNPEHFAAARPFLDAARGVLDANTRAQIRAGKSPQAVENLTSAAIDLSGAEATRAEVTREAIAFRQLLGTDLTAEELEAAGQDLTRISIDMASRYQDPEYLDKVVMESPILAALASSGPEGLAAVRQALLEAYKQSLVPGGFANAKAMSPIEVAAAVQAATDRYMDLVLEASQADNETTAMVALSKALSGYEAHREQLAPYSREMAATRFPVIPVSYMKGKFFKKPGIRLITWMPPVELQIAPTEYANWLSLIEAGYNTNGADYVIEQLEKDPNWKAAGESGRRFILTQLASAGVRLPGLDIEILTEAELVGDEEDDGTAVAGLVLRGSPIHKLLIAMLQGASTAMSTDPGEESIFRRDRE